MLISGMLMLLNEKELTDEKSVSSLFMTGCASNREYVMTKGCQRLRKWIPAIGINLCCAYVPESA